MSVDLPGWQHRYSGKVRDLYTPADGATDRMLVVASDRVSAFDHVLEPGIPGKGMLLTKLSVWWFQQLRDVPNHLLEGGVTTGAAAGGGSIYDSGTTGLVGSSSTVPEVVADRAMLVKTLEMFPIECVVRGYLSGSGWAEYQQSQSVCGVALPAGLRDGDRLPEPIYTPAWKAPLGEHDENISFERTVQLVGADVATSLRDLSLDIFRRASDIALARGVILADTKFEFGADVDGVITLADEVLTSDSSRYWDAELYATGDRTASFDKQIVRNWLLQNWDRAGTPPTLPDEIVERTAHRYRELIDRLTGV